MAPSQVAPSGQTPRRKRAARPARLSSRSSALDNGDADNEAAPLRSTWRTRRARIEARQAVGTGEVETIVEIFSDSSDSDGISSPDSPDSPPTPVFPLPELLPAPPSTTTPAPSLLPPLEPFPILPPLPVEPVIETTTPPPAPTPTPPPELPVVEASPLPEPEPAQGNGPVTLTPIAPPPRASRLPQPVLDTNPIRNPGLNEGLPAISPIEAPLVQPSFEASPSLQPESTTTSVAPPLFASPTTTTTSSSTSSSSSSSTTTTDSVTFSFPPRKGVESPSLDLLPTDGSPFQSSVSTTTTTTSSIADVTAFPVEGEVASPNRSRMDADTEHALIAVGSIGSFIFACFIGFVVWWSVRRSRKKRRERQSQLTMQGSPPPPYAGSEKTSRLATKVPLFKKFAKQRQWQSLDEGHAGQQGVFDEKAAIRGTLQLDTGFYAPPNQANAAYQGQQQYMSPVNVSPTSTMVMRSNTVTAQQGTYQPTENGTINNIIGNYAGSGTGGFTGQQAGQAYYQSGGNLEAYGQGRPRQNRTSEISSLSSGFGDAEFLNTLVPPPAVAPRAPGQNGAGAGRNSWTSRGNRETIYTETSEDSPPRFRTVNSWVNQQTGRVKRQQARAGDSEDVPPVPGLPSGVGMPPEPQFTMMMPDGEVPRRPDGGYTTTT